MFEPQPLQTLWITGMTAHQERMAQVEPRPASPGRASRPALLRILAALAQRAALVKRGPRKSASACPDCCPAEAGC